MLTQNQIQKIQDFMNDNKTMFDSVNDLMQGTIVALDLYQVDLKMIHQLAQIYFDLGQILKNYKESL